MGEYFQRGISQFGQRGEKKRSAQMLRNLAKLFILIWWSHQRSKGLHNCDTLQVHVHNTEPSLYIIRVGTIAKRIVYMMVNECSPSSPIYFSPHVSPSVLRSRDHPESLSDNASAFSSRAKQLHRRMWWRDTKVGCLFCVWARHLQRLFVCTRVRGFQGYTWNVF